MHKRIMTVEWHIAESDAEWNRVVGLPILAAHPPLFPKYSLWSLTTLFILLVVSGGWGWYIYQSRSHLTRAELSAATAQDLWIVTYNNNRLVKDSGSNQHERGRLHEFALKDSDLRVAIQTDDRTSHLDVALHIVNVQGDQAIVSIVTTAKEGAPPYRQTRFYQDTPAGWRSIAPETVLWGPEQNLESMFFRFHFRRHDAPAIIAVAAHIDALYIAIRRNFGLPIMPDVEKLVIDICVTQRPGDTLLQRGVRVGFQVPSPVLYAGPGEWTDSDILLQSITLSMIEHVLAQANKHHAMGPFGQSMLNGLRLWQVWDLDLPLATWRTDVVKWIYVSLPSTRFGQASVLPDHHTTLCIAHKLWMSSPMQLNIPLMCGRPELEKQIRDFRSPLLPLGQLTVLPMQNKHKANMDAYQVPYLGLAVVQATVIEYAVAAYGREHLPLLVVRLGQHKSWETLLPSVFGVSAAEFEAGWQAYLATRYSAVVEVKLPLY